MIRIWCLTWLGYDVWTYSEAHLSLPDMATIRFNGESTEFWYGMDERTYFDETITFLREVEAEHLQCTELRTTSRISSVSCSH